LPPNHVGKQVAMYEYLLGFPTDFALPTLAEMARKSEPSFRDVSQHACPRRAAHQPVARDTQRSGITY